MYNSRTSLYIEFDIIELFNVGLRAGESSLTASVKSPLYLRTQLLVKIRLFIELPTEKTLFGSGES